VLAAPTKEMLVSLPSVGREHKEVQLETVERRSTTLHASMDTWQTISVSTGKICEAAREWETPEH